MEALPTPDPAWCLFLDFDGTLVELRDHPDQVEAPRSLSGLLLSLLEALGGAVAIVSGRSVSSLERLLTPLQLPLAGVHGLERRDARGVLHRNREASVALRRVHPAVERFVNARAGLHWENKGGALALHYRGAPKHEAEVRDFLETQRAALGDEFHVQAGKSVLELKPVGRDKGRVVAEFMQEPPFTGRVPVFVGDDRTDEDAFAWVNAHGGISVRVGEPDIPSAAHFRTDSVGETLAWLKGIPQDLAARMHSPAQQ